MVNTQELQDLLASGGTVLDSSGSKIGKIEQAFLDDSTSEPEWVTVKTGMFGGAETFVPLKGARISGDDVTVVFSKDKVKDAPRVEGAEGHLSSEEEAELYRYYGQDYSPNHDTTTDARTGTTDTGAGIGTTTSTTDDTITGTTAGTTTGTREDDRGDRTDRTQGYDTSGPATDDAMTRSEEQLKVGTEKVSGGKARLRKYVVTENVTKTVPVSHEEVRIEREPITEANRGDATSGGDITSEEHEVDLMAEQVVIDKDVVPVERVTMGTETVTEEQQVSEEVRKEQIDTSEAETPTGTTDTRGAGTGGTTGTATGTETGDKNPAR